MGCRGRWPALVICRRRTPSGVRNSLHPAVAGWLQARRQAAPNPAGIRMVQKGAELCFRLAHTPTQNIVRVASSPCAATPQPSQGGVADLARAVVRGPVRSKSATSSAVRAHRGRSSFRLRPLKIHLCGCVQRQSRENATPRKNACKRTFFSQPRPRHRDPPRFPHRRSCVLAAAVLSHSTLFFLCCTGCCCCCCCTLLCETATCEPSCSSSASRPA